MKRRIIAILMVIVLTATSSPIMGTTVFAAKANTVASVSLGWSHSAAVTTNGDLYCWGNNEHGQIGNDTTTNQREPVKILENIKSVSLGGYYSAAVTTNGDLYCWGINDTGQIGNETTGYQQLTPVKVLENVTSISMGENHSAAVTTNGDLYCWGHNGYGQIGNGITGIWQNTPVKVLENVISISQSYGHSAAVTTNGDLYCWGNNENGQIGNGTTKDQLTPVKVLENVTSVSLGSDHSAAVTKNGDLYCWGDNFWGQIGNGITTTATTGQLTPVKVLENVTSVSLGSVHSAAVTKDGDLYCWGYNNWGQVGNGTTTGQLTPIKVLENVASVSLDYYQSAAVTTNGDLYCWGRNDYGQIGTETTTYTPVKVLENVTSVSLGSVHSAAVTTNGDLYCWGSNGSGQIGNASNYSVVIPPAKVLLDGGTDKDNPPTGGGSTEEETPPTGGDTREKATGDTSGQSSAKLKLGNSVKFTVPKDVPVIGGEPISMDFTNIPIQFEQEGNTYKIGIGVSDLKKFDKEGWFDFKKFVDTQKEDCRKGINSLLASKFGTATMGWSVKPKISCYGYAEGVITRDGVQSCEGKMMLEIKVKANKEWQTTVVVVPVVIKASGEVGAKATLSLGLDFDEGYCYAKGELDVTLPKIKLSAGVGVAYIADVSVYGSADNKITFTDKETTNKKHTTEAKAVLTGEFGVSAKVLFAKYEKPLLKGSWEYYNSKIETKTLSANEPLYIYQAPSETDVYNIDRTYSTSTVSRENELTLASYADQKEIDILASNVYNNTEPLLVQTDNGVKVLIYTEDIEERSTGNHTAVVYSIYDDTQSAWTEPVIVEDDGTADFYPSVAVDGENVVIVWSDSKKVFTEEETEADTFLTDMAASCEIKAAVLDVFTKDIHIEKLTDDDYMDMCPSVTAKDGQIFTVWYKNTENDLFELSGKNVIYTAVKKGDTWEVSHVADNNVPVLSVTAGYLQDEPVVAYVMDQDKDQSTITDEQLMVSDLEGNRTCIAKDTVCANPQFVEVDGEQTLFWYQKTEDTENICYITEITGQPDSLLDDESSITRNYTIVSGDISDLLLYTTEETETDSRNLYAYLLKDGMAEGPVQLTDVESYIEKPVGIYNNDDGYVTAFLKRDVEIAEDSVTESTDLCMLGLTAQGRLSITGIDYMNETMLPGESTTVTVEVKNDGLADCSGGKIQVLGADGSSVLGSVEFTDTLSVGETKSYEVAITLPEDMQLNDTYTVQLTSGTSIAVDTFQPSFTDIGLSVAESDDGYILDISNNGGFDLDTNLVIYDKDLTGDVLTTDSLGVIEQGETVQRSFTKEELAELGDSLCISAESTDNVKELFDFDNQVYLYVGEDIMRSLDHLEAYKNTVSYTIGDILNVDDLEVIAVYNNEEEEEVTDYTTNVAEIDMSVAGTKELVITYEENYVVRTVSFDIEVTNKSDNTETPGGENPPVVGDDGTGGQNPPAGDNTEIPEGNGSDKNVIATGLKLTGISKKIAAGKKITLAPVFTPTNVANKKLQWTSSNKKYATVNSKGVVTTKKKGAGKSVTITATTQDGSNKKAVYKISIMKHAVKSVKLTAKSNTVKAGKKLTLKATVKTTGKKVNKVLQWTSSNTKYATVTKKGVVKTKKAGKGKTVKITAKATDGTNKKATIKIKLK